MLNKRIEKELNKQLNAEFFSAYLYLSMASYLNSINLQGFSHWMRMQFEEEQFHALKLNNYILERGGKVKLLEIKEPKSDWNGIIDVFKDVLAHEQLVTSLINDLVSVAMEEKDHATTNMLQWFVSEQVEEEATVGDFLDQLKLIDGKGAGLFILDREAKQRVFTNPDAQAE